MAVALLNGETLKLGDSVYDILHGYGVVDSVNRDGSFAVKFSEGVTQFYSRGGFIGPKRRIYWRDPITIDPPKRERFWRIYVTSAKAQFVAMQELCRMNPSALDEDNELA